LTSDTFAGHPRGGQTSEERGIAVPVREVAGGIWSITVPLSPGVLSVYLVRGTSLALIDTGYLYTLPAIDTELRTLGLSFADVDLVLMTHGHPDHVGACAEIGGRRSLVHRDDLALLGGPAAHLASDLELSHVMRALDRDKEARTRERFVHDSVGAAVTGAEALDDGQVVDLGAGRRLTVVHTPGHTPGSAVLLAEPDGVAFTGDAVQAWGGRPGVLPLYADPVAYRASLDRIAELDPHTLALGHPYRWSGGGSTPDVIRTGPAARATLRESVTYAETARAAVARVLDSAPLTAAELAQRTIDELGAPYWTGGPGWEAASAQALLALAHSLGWRPAE
jgi:glyoxylase-like metal-dependent hydrolase (beta-lactamase superfamily II)